jgi:hypothetical protein
MFYLLRQTKFILVNSQPWREGKSQVTKFLSDMHIFTWEVQNKKDKMKRKNILFFRMNKHKMKKKRKICITMWKQQMKIVES